MSISDAQNHTFTVKKKVNSKHKELTVNIQDCRCTCSHVTLNDNAADALITSHPMYIVCF